MRIIWSLTLSTKPKRLYIIIYYTLLLLHLNSMKTDTKCRILVIFIKLKCRCQVNRYLKKNKHQVFRNRCDLGNVKILAVVYSIIKRWIKKPNVTICKKFWTPCTFVHARTSLVQHGFMSRRYTLTNLMIVITQYINIEKAFHRIDFYILLNKLRSFGLSSNLCGLTLFYLSDKKQVVVCQQTFSLLYSVFTSSNIKSGSSYFPDLHKWLL